MADSKRSTTSTANKSKKSKNDIMRTVVGAYLRQRNYMANDRYRKSDLILSQSTEQIVMNTSIKNEISRSNSFSFSNIFCLNNNPAQVDQHFAKLTTFIKSQPDPIKKELFELVSPLLCHLYIEMLKGRDWRPAIEFLKKYASLVGTLESPSNSVPLINQKINGTVDEQQATPHLMNSSAISFVAQDSPSTSTESTFKEMVHKLSQIVRIQDTENDPLIASFRSCKYELKLSSLALIRFQRYLAKSGHSLILQILQTWFHIETLDDKNFVDYSPNIAGEDYEYDFSEHNDNENVKHLLLNGFSTNFVKFKLKAATANNVNSINHQAMDIDDDEDMEEMKISNLDDNVSRLTSNERLEMLKDSVGKLNQYHLPVCIYNLENADDRLTSSCIDQHNCHIATGFEDSSITLWSVNRSTQHGRKPYATFRDGQCDWNVINCDSSYSDEDEEDEQEIREMNRANKLLPIYSRKTTKRERWKQFMEKKCSENIFSDSGGLTLRGHGNAITDLIFSSHNPLLLSVSRDLTMRAWKASDYNCCAIYRGHNHPIWCVTESSTGLYIATGSKDMTARLWSTDREFPLQIYAGHTQDVDTVAFHPNGNYLATGSTDLTVRLWCVTSGKLFRIFTDCRLPIHRICFSPDGKYLAAAGEETRVRIFDLAAGSQITELKDHTATVTSIGWSPDSRHFASSCADGTIRVWDVSKISSSAINTSAMPASSSSTNSSNSSPKTSASNNLLLAYSTGCRKIYKLHYNQLNGTLSCIGNS